jgi:hypothetical protein
MKEGEGKLEIGLGWVCHGDEKITLLGIQHMSPLPSLKASKLLACLCFDTLPL